MKYNFLKFDGSLFETNNLFNVKKDLTWNMLNNFIPFWNLTKKEKEFLDKYELPCSIFNVSCLQHLNMVYLPDYFYKIILKKLKEGNE